MSEAGSRPLEGITVVALEQAVAAPLASARLADAGARVIKVERPEGDFARGYDTMADGISAYFGWLNGDKESIVLDLKDEADLAVMRQLINRADVFIQNLAVGATARLGLDAATLRVGNPGLIVCDLSGYGTEGPYAEMKAYDLLVQAESGILSVSGPPGPYGRVGVSLVDLSTGLNAAIGVMQALYRKARTGEGAHLETSLFASAADWMTVPLLQHDSTGSGPERVGLAHPSISPYGGFETLDGDVVVISIQSDREWRTLCADVIQRPELGTDERFATNPDRMTNRDQTDGLVASAFQLLERSVIIERLRSARIAFGEINDVAGLSRHPQLKRTENSHSGGAFSLPAPPVSTDWARDRHVPDLDQHGAAIRRELLDG
jgi:itaconate CoA-transferase